MVALMINLRRAVGAMIIALISMAAVGCGETGSDILHDDKVQKAVRAQNAKDQNPCFVLGADSSNAKPGDLTGTFSTISCTQTSSSDGVGDGQSCSTDLTLTNEHDGRITQVNQGAISSGNGEGFIYGGPIGSATVVVKNHATGAGCSQDVVGLLHFTPLSASPGTWDVCAIAVFLDSNGCPAPDWKASHATVRRK